MSKKPPKVRLVKPKGRNWQLRYLDPETKKEIRISCKTDWDTEAKELKKQLEAKLVLGLDTKPKKVAGGPGMDWKDFRRDYSTLWLKGLRHKTRMAAESRLDIAEKILKLKKLSDLATPEALTKLQAELQAGTESKGKKRRSKHTVKGYMGAIIAALNWAKGLGWVQSVPDITRVKVSKSKLMKGRPLCLEEFERMLAAVEGVVGEEAKDSWSYLLKGIWESGLRLEEIMNFHWSDQQYIVPQWEEDKLPILIISAPLQKNDCEQSIPMVPGLETLLLETPEPQRFGFCFNPLSLQTKLGRPVRYQRPDAEWVGKVISRIGKAAGVIVEPAKGDKPAKYASAHDLRRSCGERLVSAGLDIREVSKILRHEDIETTLKYYASGQVQISARLIHEKLGSVPRKA